MTSQRVPPALGYESPTEHTVTSALATNHLMHRLSELEQSQRQRQNVGQNELPREAMNMDDLVSQSGKLGNSKPVGIKDRIACFQWTWFTSTMATGGIANVLASIPFQAQWLYIVGVIFCIFNMCLFVTNSVLLLMRFYLRPGSFRHSFTDQFEALFIPASHFSYPHNDAGLGLSRVSSVAHSTVRRKPCQFSRKVRAYGLDQWAADRNGRNRGSGDGILSLLHDFGGLYL
ncbi:Malic acid transport protein [Cytospora mali]|uniref:Malic acid transport protein n=1 Tax=Cytospora mali TaxID=578113 RepID=A0A194VUL3_CYTMA|nr:Malic acid transport protein [Valsa mali]